MKINVGFLVAYDYELLKISIPLVYEHTNAITLALDINRQTWSGNTFKVDPNFFNWVKEFDTDNKITIYEDDFYDASLNAMENDTRERNMLAEQMGDGICIQIDADEYFVDFKGFTEHLRKNKKKLTGKKAIQICSFMVDVYKVLEDGILYCPTYTNYYLGTTKANYTRARKNKNQEKWYVPFISIHQSWSRDEKELKFKLDNWGHNIDFDVDSFFEFWKSINKGNYKDHKDFHPFDKKEWPTLEYIEGKDFNEIIENFKDKKVSKSFIFGKNSAQKAKFLFK
ncbi:hypothetical protein [Lacinutrix sp. Bg11-31]|uniref:hypothetical protein n=1 Tax=Lacinutrix sp. Bg11-31 TaxID=2057808 RepID=UPI0012FDD24B|nr:hypothetical protein [Lacinutrix sp. Bg11-31]